MSLFILYINILKVVLVNLGKIKYLRNYNNNEVYIVIKGKGIQNLLSNQFNYDPSAVFVNGKRDNSCKKSCNLKKDTNNIILQFSQQINTLESMFLDLQNIEEIDLSDFDASQVTNMATMFRGCSNLISVYLSNSYTNYLVNISAMFAYCSNLVSINFGNIITSSVEDMEKLFYECSS